MPSTPEKAEQAEDRWPEDRWPVVTLYANGQVADPHLFDDVEYVDPPEETYYPASHPAVLSPEEARLLVHLAKIHGLSFSGADLRALIDRLSTHRGGPDA